MAKIEINNDLIVKGVVMALLGGGLGFGGFSGGKNAYEGWKTFEERANRDHDEIVALKAKNERLKEDIEDLTRKFWRHVREYRESGVSRAIPGIPWESDVPRGASDRTSDINLE